MRPPAALASLAAAAAARPGFPPPPPPSPPSAPRRLSVSGQSAGGSMAVSHLVAFSSRVTGAGIASGSPYGCGSLTLGSWKCSFGGVSVAKVMQYARQRFSQGLIDDPANLKNTPVVLFRGADDMVVWQAVMTSMVQQFSNYSADVVSVFNTSAAHVWPQDHGECACGACEYDYYEYYKDYFECCDVNNCGYDLAGDILRRAHPARSAWLSRVPARSGEEGTDLWWVNQNNYIPKRRANDTWKDAGVMKWGLVYVPTACQQSPGDCDVHVNYHGCGFSGWPSRRKWASQLDLNEYGEANSVVIVYPQAEAHGDCWNWDWPKDDPLYDTRESVQLRTVNAIVDDIANIVGSPRGACPPDEPGCTDGQKTKPPPRAVDGA